MTTSTQPAAVPPAAARRSDRTWTLIRWASPLALLALWQAVADELLAELSPEQIVKQTERHAKSQSEGNGG